MAADQELPRGWHFGSTANAAGTATITVPAITGVSHVLDAVSYKAACYAVSSGSHTPILLIQGVFFDILTVSLAAIGSDQALLELNQVIGTNLAVTVTFDRPAVGGIWQSIFISGHDI